MSAPVYTLADYHRRRVWRERGLKALAVLLVGVVLPALLAWVCLGAAMPMVP